MPLTDFNQLPLPECARQLVSDAVVCRLMETAFGEDGFSEGDITTMSIIPEGRDVEATFVARQPGVVAGLSILQRATGLSPVKGRLDIEPALEDGRHVKPGETIGYIRGSWRDVLACERVFLNLLSRLSGVATQTARYVSAVEDVASEVLICDSRKTTPGLRLLEKYAVRCGGGHLHRIGLHDAVMYKDNHLAALGSADLGDSLKSAIEKARADRPLRFVCVEVDRLDQLDEVLAMDEGLVDIVLLDNMGCADLLDAIERRNASGRSIMLEASGGVTLETVADIARTGVDRIAVGAMTHGVKWLDIGLDIKPGVDEA